MTMMRPCRTYFYPLMDPPRSAGYKVDIYNNLVSDGIMIYEVYKPYVIFPYTFLVEYFTDHLDFFHTLWNTDEFDMCAADRHFLMRLWHHLCPHRGPWNPAAFEISIDLEREPKMYRYTARSLIHRYLTDSLDVLDICPESDEEEDGNKMTVGR